MLFTKYYTVGFKLVAQAIGNSILSIFSFTGINVRIVIIIQKNFLEKSGTSSLLRLLVYIGLIRLGKNGNTFNFF